MRVLLVEDDRKASRVLKRLGLAISRAPVAALVVAAANLASGCAPTAASLAEYVAATPEDAAVLAPLEAIMSLPDAGAGYPPMFTLVYTVLIRV